MKTFFKSVIANLRCFFVIVGVVFLDIIERTIALCCLLAIVGIMFIGMFFYAVILTPIAAGFVLGLIAYKVYKKIFS